MKYEISESTDDLPRDADGKVISLTRAQYLPLARRTLRDDLKGDTEAARIARMLYLCIGAFDEYGELRESEFMTGKFCAEEAGDVLWYVEQALDELPDKKPENFEGYRHLNTIKKAIAHERDEHIDLLSGWLHYIRERVDVFSFRDGTTLGEVRLQNIKKLYRRYPGGFETGGGRDRSDSDAIPACSKCGMNEWTITAHKIITGHVVGYRDGKAILEGERRKAGDVIWRCKGCLREVAG